MIILLRSKITCPRYMGLFITTQIFPILHPIRLELNGIQGLKFGFINVLRYLCFIICQEIDIPMLPHVLHRLPEHPVVHKLEEVLLENVRFQLGVEVNVCR